MNRLSLVMGFFLLTAVSSFGQMELGNFYSRDVKQAVTVATNVDSVAVSTVLNNGLAETNVTITLTPTGTKSVNSRLDSIEISLSFWLPSDFVAKEMWLWVNGEPQRAYVQDRTLASSQYNQIVGTRKDPALLEFWGNGRFTFRMFPAELNQSRKFAILFQHTFDDDTLSLLRAIIPVTFDSAYAYYSTQARVVGNATFDITVRDQRVYTVTIPGVGNGTASAQSPLKLSATKVPLLGRGEITATKPSAAEGEFFWSGLDMHQRVAVGCAALIAESTVTLAPEPDTRIIVLDVRNRWWDWDDYYNSQYRLYQVNVPSDDKSKPLDLWLKAQKYAVLCIQNYVRPGQKFNVIFAGKDVTSAFSTPVQYSTNNITAAYAAIVAKSPDSTASTLAAIQTAISQAGRGGVVILISDLYQPYDYWTIVMDQSSKVNRYEVSTNGAAFDTVISRIAHVVTTSGTIFFSITDEWKISQIAYETGGYQLAGLRGDYYYILKASEDFTGKSIPQLPKLFGSNNYAQGLRILSVNGDLDSIVYTTDGYEYRYYMFDGPMLAVAKRSLVWWPYYGQNMTTLRIAGILPQPRSSTMVNLTVKGRLGGLEFTKEIKGYFSMDDLFTDNDQWAFIKSEQLANADWNANAEAIKSIGKQYHIVTRQTALLALEPGMELWPDTNSQHGGGNERLALDAAMAPGGTIGFSDTIAGNSLDNTSLQDLIAMNVGVWPAVNRAFNNGIEVALIGSMVRISLPAGSPASDLKISMYDIAGRLLVVKIIGRDKINDNVYVGSFASIAAGKSTGCRIVKIVYGKHRAVFPVIPQ